MTIDEQTSTTSRLKRLIGWLSSARDWLTRSEKGAKSWLPLVGGVSVAAMLLGLGAIAGTWWVWVAIIPLAGIAGVLAFVIIWEEVR